MRVAPERVPAIAIAHERVPRLHRAMLKCNGAISDFSGKKQEKRRRFLSVLKKHLGQSAKLQTPQGGGLYKAWKPPPGSGEGEREGGETKFHSLRPLKGSADFGFGS